MHRVRGGRERRMSFSDWLPALATQALMMTPLLIVYAAGLTLCLTRRRQLGVASTYAAIAFALLIAGVLLSLAGQAWSYRAISSGMPASSMAVISGVVGVSHMLLSLLATTLLVAAILARRPAP
jgi:low temperature requirement protein LtrA